MTSRERNISAYSGVLQYQYSSFDDFINGINRSGIHSVSIDGLPLDILHEVNGDELPLLVTFTAAVSPLASYPYFSGRGIARSSGFDLLAISDPSIAFSDKTGTNFYLGTEKILLKQYLRKVIEEVSRQRFTIFFGASAGGFPALQIGSSFRNSVSFVTNPVTNLLDDRIFIEHSAGINFPSHKIDDLAQLIELSVPAPENMVVYAQNQADEVFVKSHAAHYFETLKSSGKKILLLPGKWGNGHVPMPQAQIGACLSQITQGMDLVELNSSLGGKLAGGFDAMKVLKESEVADGSFYQSRIELNAQSSKSSSGKRDRSISLILKQKIYSMLVSNSKYISKRAKRLFRQIGIGKIVKSIFGSES